MLKTFKAPGKHIFHIFNFCNNYDGLIGLDLLEKLKAEIDIDKKMLNTTYGQIKIYIDELNKPKQNLIRLKPSEQRVVQIPVNTTANKVILNHQNIYENEEISTALVKVKINKTSTIFSSLNDHGVAFQLNEPGSIIKYEDYDNNEPIKFDPPSYKNPEDLQEQNISSIRTQIMNEEERGGIRAQSKQFKNTCYQKNMPLTTTSEIKHKLYPFDEKTKYKNSPIKCEEIKRAFHKQLEFNNKIIYKKEKYKTNFNPLSRITVNAIENMSTRRNIGDDVDQLDAESEEDTVNLPNTTFKQKDFVDTAHYTQADEVNQSIPSMDH
jgi:hypothetical protein